MVKHNLTSEELKTLGYYNKNAKKWLNNLAVGKDSLLFESELIKFKKLLSKGRILEIGCGAGNDAKWFTNNNYDYTGVDLSKEMISLSRKKVPDGNFQEMSVYSLDFPDKHFDGFWTSITLIHIPKTKINKALGQITRVVKDNGVGFISLKKGEGERYEESKKRFYAYYSQEEFSEVLKSNNIDVLESYTKPLGKTTFLIYFVSVEKLL